MRLTCLKCGHQMEIATGPRAHRLNCVCGQDYSYPEVVNTGTRPNEQAAERSRSKAFRAAGVVKNVGGFALGVSLLGILFFPIALLGAGVGIYVLIVLRGPLGRYSGRRAAVAAVILGGGVFLGEGAMALTWIDARRVQKIKSTQATVTEDLRALLRAQRLFRATHDTYGTFREFRFLPPVGAYTFYLGADDLVPATRDQEVVADPLPNEVHAIVTESAFTAIAVANLDHDSYLDVWSLDNHGAIAHLNDDATDAAGETVISPPPPTSLHLVPAVDHGGPPESAPAAMGRAAKRAKAVRANSKAKTKSLPADAATVPRPRGVETKPALEPAEPGREAGPATEEKVPPEMQNLREGVELEVQPVEQAEESAESAESAVKTIDELIESAPD